LVEVKESSCESFGKRTNLCGIGLKEIFVRITQEFHDGLRLHVYKTMKRGYV
jgi:hypothetical protein